MNITKTTLRGQPRWLLDYRVNGKRIQRYFKSKAAAESESSFLRGQQQASGDVWLSLSAAEKMEMGQIASEVRASGHTLREVWAHFKMERPAINSRRTIRDTIAELLDSKTAGGRRSIYLHALRIGLARFAKGREESFMDAITADTIREWMDSRDWADSTRRTNLKLVISLFAFAEKRGYIAINPCRQIDIPTVDQKPPQVLTPEQARQCLVWTKENMPLELGSLALGLFAGVRPYELTRMDNAALDLDRGTLTVDAAASKVRRRRIVYLMPAAVKWLRLGCHLPSTPQRRDRWFLSMRVVLGFKTWPVDILRHTAASYLMAHHRDAGKVAAGLGNSASILMNHYHELVSAADADAFWSTEP